MCGTGELLLLAALVGQPAEVPAWARAAPDFYGAVAGGDLSVTLSATPTELPRDADTTLTLTVKNARNPGDVRRPPLAKLPPFADRFQIADAASPPAGKDVRFVWTLRPKAEGVIEVPGLRFAYFNPARPDGKLPTKITDPIRLTVRPPAPVASVDPLPAAERLFALPAGGPRWAPPLAVWAAVPVLAGLLGFGWAAAWRWRNPDGARLAKLRRVRAVRRVLDRLAGAERAPDPAAAAAVALRDYFIERYGAAVTGPVPAEADAALRAVGVSADRAAEAAAFFRRCDAMRFAESALRPSPSASEDLVEDLTGARARTEHETDNDLPAAARRLVLAWEDAG